MIYFYLTIRYFPKWSNRSNLVSFVLRAPCSYNLRSSAAPLLNIPRESDSFKSVVIPCQSVLDIWLIIFHSLRPRGNFYFKDSRLIDIFMFIHYCFIAPVLFILFLLFIVTIYWYYPSVCTVSVLLFIVSIVLIHHIVILGLHRRRATPWMYCGINLYYYDHHHYYVKSIVSGREHLVVLTF